MPKRAPRTKKSAGHTLASAQRAMNPRHRAKGRGPRSQVLPTLEQIRSVKLDNVCEGIAEERAAMNKAATEEKGLKAKALDIMQHADPPYTIYKHGGVELARVPGADKLRIRLTDDDGDASVSGGTTSQEGSAEPAGE